MNSFGGRDCSSNCNNITLFLWPYFLAFLLSNFGSSSIAVAANHLDENGKFCLMVFVPFTYKYVQCITFTCHQKNGCFLSLTFWNACACWHDMVYLVELNFHSEMRMIRQSITKMEDRPSTLSIIMVFRTWQLP
jgi:hypothetical protein